MIFSTKLSNWPGQYPCYSKQLHVSGNKTNGNNNKKYYLLHVGMLKSFFFSEINYRFLKIDFLSIIVTSLL